MINLTSMFDNYGRQARLYPGLLTLFPPLLTAIAWFPELISSSIGATLLTIASSCGLLYGLAVVSRTQGKGTEKRLLCTWGGWPTTLWLRRSSDFLQPQTLARYHRYLTANVPGLELPSREDEAGDPASADLAYSSAVKWLQERCRGKEFPLLEKENAEYGFRRNLRGMRPIGLLLCLLAAIFSANAILQGHHDLVVALVDLSGGQCWHALTGISPPIVGATIVDLIAIAGWLTIVRDQWVRDAGDQYARALLATCDKLAPTKQKATKPPARKRTPGPQEIT
jgi:hypothetical protein